MTTENFKFQIGQSVKFTDKGLLACLATKGSSIPNKSHLGILSRITQRKHSDGYAWYLTDFTSNWVTEEGLELENKPEEDLLAEAARRYPIGTEYTDVGSCTFGTQRAKYAPKWVNGNKERGNIEVGIGYVRYNGKWAEVVDRPIEEKKKELPYKQDDWVVVAEAIQGRYPRVLQINKIELHKSQIDKYQIYSKKKDGAPDWFHSDHIERFANIGEMQEAGYKPAPISNILNEVFGMKVGDVLKKEDLNEWIFAKGDNEYNDRWKKANVTYNSDQKIVKIEEIEGVIAYKVSNFGTLYIRAQGYKEFCQNRNKGSCVVYTGESLPSLQQDKSIIDYWNEYYKGQINAYIAGVDPYQLDSYEQHLMRNISVFDKKAIEKQIQKLEKEDVSGYIQTPVILKKPKKSGIIYV